jgi:hypothetical protein
VFVCVFVLGGLRRTALLMSMRPLYLAAADDEAAADGGAVH